MPKELQDLINKLGPQNAIMILNRLTSAPQKHKAAILRDFGIAPQEADLLISNAATVRAPVTEGAISPKQLTTLPVPEQVFKEGTKPKEREGVFGLLPEKEVSALQEAQKLEQEEAKKAQEAFEAKRAGIFGRIEETGGREAQELEAARQRLQQELTGAIPEEQKQLEDARQRFLSESLGYTTDVGRRLAEAQAPVFQERIRQAREQLGARGLGTGGVEGSGALASAVAREASMLEAQRQQQLLGQELGARQRAAELGVQFGIEPIEQRRRARDIFGELGLEAGRLPGQFRRQRLAEELGLGKELAQMGLGIAGIPTAYRRGALERGFGLSDAERQEQLQRELAQIGAMAQGEAARQQARGSKKKGIGSIIGTIGGLIATGGNPFGAVAGSEIGETLGGFF